MSLKKTAERSALIAFLIASATTTVHAQSDEEGDEEEDEEGDDDDDDEEEEGADPEGPFPGEGRFFFEKPRLVGEAKKTRFTGSVTSSTFLYRELGVSLSEPENMGPDDAGAQGTAQRLMTDLRVQVNARDIKGGAYSFLGDVRGRFVPGSCKVNSLELLDDNNPCQRLQSGSFSGNELDIREIYLTRAAKKLELRVGRQFVLDLAAHRLDGGMVRYKTSKKTTYIGFAGLHPQKGSRDIREDYPRTAVQSDGASKRLMPITGGGGIAYRFDRLYGSFGLVGILPLAEAQDGPGEPGQLETPRAFLSASGYFRTGPKLDVYHYLVFDAVGSAAGALTNLTVGLNARPAPRLRANLTVTRVDTETLSAAAEAKLETPDGENGVLQNNVEVLRIAQDAVRAGVSGTFKQRRFELSTSIAVRQRPEVVLRATGDTPVELTLPAARDIEAMVSFTDRRSFQGFRLSGSVSRSFGLGDERFQRASTLSIRGSARKPVMSGKGELDAFLSFVKSDSTANFTGMGGPPPCAAADNQNNFEGCFAGSGATAVSIGGAGFYRLGRRLMAIGTLSFGRTAFTTPDVLDTGGAARDSQGAITPVVAFLRLAYRL